MFTCGAPDDPLATQPANVAAWNSGILRQKVEFQYDHLGRRVREEGLLLERGFVRLDTRFHPPLPPRRVERDP